MNIGNFCQVYAVVGSQLELFCTRSQYFGVCGWKSGGLLTTNKNKQKI